MANWEELPRELLKLIPQRLAIEDFLAFGGVCTSWRSAAVKETYDVKSKAPWLVTYVYNQAPEFCSPSTGRIYRVKLPGPQAQTLSSPGWILVSSLGCEGCIFKPLSRISIELPTLEKLRHELPLRAGLNGPVLHLCSRLRIAKSALSSSLSFYSIICVLILIRRRCVDGSESGDPPWSDVLQLIYNEGLFVALDAHNHIMILDDRERRMEWRLAPEQNFQGRPYLVECSGSLLVAWKTRGGEGNRFRIFEVDLEKGTQEEVKSSGSASGSCLPGIKPNHVYYVDDEKKKKKNKRYSMDNGKVETYFDAAKVETYFNATSHRSAGQWFRPDF
ncbi:hypothetical protein ACJRO7_012992 [Eucalyptus globulus]|uniref:F-box domain-containing protein n=1 Tax=Eucalyptus globulus TaxID=34317 RepID=A0ABD3LKI4_EUCGL